LDIFQSTHGAFGEWVSLQVLSGWSLDMDPLRI